ncbi:E3 ubiquitin-protein ligase [Cercospora beticola]|uniref:E3 ubiquitin-protein ligase n=1 Tax=Cercospora beticola TaxID=122368 RepID=A0A2G5HKH3_CERBT|nr:E3 ubiquitin-protein ligase [Cercospora beticola]PIA93015.1 E3 ubiquitin-protein ligase [Cercospora beticola]WPB01321.1 hypothetical protein RHO25_005945 [Cercospora beticola]
MDHVPLPKSGRLWKTKADFFRPFRSAAAQEATDKDNKNPSGSGISPLYDPTLLPEETTEEKDEPDLRELNSALLALVDIFPDVQPEVFREMLVSVSEESRLQIVTEHLLVKKAKWAKGRYRTPRGTKRVATPTTAAVETRPRDVELFRSEAYKDAVKQVFYQEFKTLSKSTVRGVLAEQNFSYTLARPVLQQVAAKSWRFSLTSFWTRRATDDATEVRNHPFIVWQSLGDSEASPAPAVRRTGSSQLDHELHELFVAPILKKQEQERARIDYEVASKLNEDEAEELEALFDCECCYSSVTFEKLATCDDACHVLCLECIKRTVNEALYGQGWARAADMKIATVRCFASAECPGNIPKALLYRALTEGQDNEDVWNEFQARVSSEALLQSGLSLQRCPFCSYAEIQEYPKPRLKQPMAVWEHVARYAPPGVQLIFLTFIMALSLFTAPLLALGSALWLLIRLIPPAAAVLDRSILRIQKRRQNLKFVCRHPKCLRISCIRCTALWNDPHNCFESEKTSLRTAIETSATAAVKRTCPKCMLSFVKSSGCNKLVCNCGYTMCYICRSEITSREGYAHFCQHFRPNGGKCAECERCDLYGDEDEEAAIRRAAEAAEKAWREQEDGKAAGGESNKVATQLMIDALVGERKRQWYDEWLDSVLDVIIA